jgi:hypothetical protein
MTPTQTSATSHKDDITQTSARSHKDDITQTSVRSHKDGITQTRETSHKDDITQTLSQIYAAKVSLPTHKQARIEFQLRTSATSAYILPLRTITAVFHRQQGCQRQQQNIPVKRNIPVKQHIPVTQTAHSDST